WWRAAFGQSAWRGSLLVSDPSPSTWPPGWRTARGERTMARSKPSSAPPRLPDAGGHFGVYGGRYVSETLMPALLVLERAYARLKRDASFQRELHGWLKRYAGRPTPDRKSTRLNSSHEWISY